MSMMSGGYRMDLQMLSDGYEVDIQMISRQYPRTTESLPESLVKSRLGYKEG